MSDSITIAQTEVTTRDFLYTIRGTRTGNVTSVTVDGTEATLDPGGWRYTASLSAGENVFEIKGYVNATLIGQDTVTITVPTTTLELQNTWNVLDEWGIELGTPRLLGESNRSYKQRLLDAAEHPGGSSPRRLLRSSSRAIGLEPEYSALTVDLNTNQDGTPYGSNVYFGVTHSDIRFTASELRTESTVRIESSKGTVDVSAVLPIADTDTIRAFEVGGDEISREEFWYDDVYDVIRFDRDHRGKWINLVYQYQERVIPFNQTLAEIKVALEQVVNQDGNSILSVTVNIDDTLDASGLGWTGYISLTTPLDLVWSRLSLRELGDTDYQEFWYNDDGHAYNTRLEKWARQVQTMTRSGWKNIILDVDAWEEESIPAGLPHLRDALHTFWKVSGDDTRYESSRKFYLGNTDLTGKTLERKGIDNDHWKAGVADMKDVKPVDVLAVVEGG